MAESQENLPTAQLAGATPAGSSPAAPSPAAPSPASPSPASPSPASPSLGRPPSRPPLDVSYFVRLGLSALTVLVIGILLLVLLGLAQRFGWITAGGPAGGPAADAAAGEVYTCPMHPQIRQPNPGSCPLCGMPLELATTGDGEGAQDEYAVTVQPAARRLANIRTAPVELKTVEKTIDSVGRIAIDESRQATIAAYVAGRVERLFADYTGVDVQRGDHLAVIYSPQLYGAQVEYLESRRTLEGMQGAALAAVRRSQERLVASARERLAELGMTAEQLAELDQTGAARSRVTIYAPSGGTVIEKLLVEGQYVEVGEPIYRIADLSTVWLMLQIFPEDAALMRFGQRVEVETQSLPGTIFEGRIAFINPVVDRQTRTVDVRIEMLNEGRWLRPGDYARARVSVPLGERGEVYDAELAGKWISPMHPQIVRDEAGPCPICGMDLVPTSRYGFADTPVPHPEVLVVPRRAVLMTGNTSLVYVETDPGRFEIRPIALGPLLRDEAVVLDGVVEGEEVAVSGNFLIDSQMQLAGKPSLIDPTRAIERPPPEGPMSLPSEAPRPLAGTAGEDLERLYAAYDALVATLAADEIPSEAQVEAVQSTAARIAEAEVPAQVRQEAENIAQHSAHLHHRSLSEAREQFKEISRSVLQLASQARGDRAETSLIHFYCSMVPGGGGDWLQAAEPPANPYWGSRMLRCVQHQEALEPPRESPPATPPTSPQDDVQQAASPPAPPTT